MMCNQCLLLNGLRVLVVDNNLDCRVLLTTVLEECGIEAIAVTSAVEALEILKQVEPDLLISELALPEVDGYSLMHQVKALKKKPQAEIPAIALTAHDSKSDRAHALSVGFCKHLSKPFDIDELIETIASLIGQLQWLTP